MTRDTAFVVVFGAVASLFFAWLTHGSTIMVAGALAAMFVAIFSDRQLPLRERVQGLLLALMLAAVVNLYWVQRSP